MEIIKQELLKQNKTNIAPFVQAHFFASFYKKTYMQDALTKEMNCFNKTM
jgi:hypothetical protein